MRVLLLLVIVLQACHGQHIVGECTADLECPLGQTCSEDGTCWDTNDQTVPLTKRLATGEAVLLTLGIAMVVGLCVFFCIFHLFGADTTLFGIENWDEIGVMCTVWVVICSVIISLLVAIASAFYFGGATDPTLISVAGDGASCSSIAALACDPYLCDMRSSACFVSCDASSMCTSPYVCRDGSCVLPMPKESKGMAFGVGGALCMTVGISVALTFIGIVVAYGITKASDDTYYLEPRWMLGLSVAVFTLLFIAIGVPSMLSASPGDDPTTSTPMPYWIAVGIAVIVAWSMCCLTVAATHPYFMYTLDSDGPLPSWATLLGPGMIMFLVVVLAVGIPLCLTQPMIPIKNTMWSAKPSRGAAETRVSPGGGIVLAVAIAVLGCPSLVGCTVLLMVSQHAALDRRFNHDEPISPTNAAFLSCGMLTCCLVVGAVMVLPLTLAEKPLPPSSVGNITCNGSAVCAPFFCQEGKCADRCEISGQCMEGYTCEGGDCVFTTTRARFSAGAVSGITLGIAIFCGLLCGAGPFIKMRVREIRRGWGDDSYFTGMLCTCVWCIIVCIIVAPILATSETHADSDLKTDPELACVVRNAAVCAPYLCGVAERLCLVQCESTTDCTEGAQCNNNECVNTKGGQPLLQPYESVGIATATVLFCWFCFIMSLCTFRLVVNHTQFAFDGPGEGFFTTMGERCPGELLFASFAAMSCCSVVLFVIIAVPLDARDSNGKTFATDSYSPLLAVGTAFGSGLALYIVIIGVLFVAQTVASNFFPEDEWEWEHMMLHAPTVPAACGCALLAVLVVGVAYSRTLVSIVSIPDYPETGLDVNNITIGCEFVFDPACYPYSCDTLFEACGQSCMTHEHCAPGHHCFTENGANVCRRVDQETTLPRDAVYMWTTFALLLFILVLFSACTSVCRHTSINRTDVIPMLCMSVFVGGAVVIFVGMPLGTKVDAVPTMRGNGTGCLVPNDVSCGLFRCDTLQEMCLTTCTAYADCKPGYTCVDGACRTGDPEFNRNTLICFASIFLCCAFPFLREVYLNLRYCYVERRRRTIVRLKSYGDDVAKEKREGHHSILDTNRAAAGGDATLPTPSSWLLEPGFDTSRFERALDDALATIPPDGVQRSPSPEPATAEVVTEPPAGAGGPSDGFDHVLDPDEIYLSTDRPEKRKSEDLDRNDGVGVAEGSSSDLDDVSVRKRRRRPKLTVDVGESSRDVPLGSDGTQVVIMGPDMSLFTAEKVVVPRMADLHPMDTPKTGLALVRRTEEECSICYAEEATVRFLGRRCAHGYCEDCGRDALQGILSAAQFPPMCPGCRAEGEDTDACLISADTVELLQNRGVIDRELAERFITMMIMRAFEPNEAVMCPVCDVMAAGVTKERGKRATLRVICPECEGDFCSKCNRFWWIHKGLSCKGLEKKMQMPDATFLNDQFLRTQIKAGNAMLCPKCGAVMTKNGGCNTVTCTCSFAVCWATKKPRYGPNGCGGGHGCH